MTFAGTHRVIGGLKYFVKPVDAFLSKFGLEVKPGNFTGLYMELAVAQRQADWNFFRGNANYGCFYSKI